MAIKKTTAVKKSDPPKKKFSPNAMIEGADFGKINRKTKDYYYEEGGQGMGGLKMKTPTGKNYTKSQGYFTTNIASGGSPVKGVFDPAKLRGYGVSYDKKGERTITPPYLMKEQAAKNAAKMKAQSLAKTKKPITKKK